MGNEEERTEKSAVLDFTRYTGLGKGELPFWLTISAVLVLGLWVAQHFDASTQTHPTAVYALVALCCLSAGSILGFLFGIPHASGAASGSSTLASGPTAARSSPSTSLEQVSDWLTKIIIGVGLVELDKIEARLATLGTLISRAVGAGAGNTAVAQLFVVTFGALGFLAGYIWTRVYYGGIQAKADVNMHDIQNVRDLAAQAQQSSEQAAVLAAQAAALATSNEQRIGANELETTTLRGQTEEIKTQSLEQELVSRGISKSLEAKKVTAPPDGLAPDPTTNPKLVDWTEKLTKFMAAAVDWDTDPTAEIFGPLPSETAQRRLAVAIISQSSATENLYFLKAEVTSVDGSRLSDKVIFLLHPTFGSKRAVEVQVERSKDLEAGCATYSFYSRGSFTLVAMADEGETVLGYDLSLLKAGW